MLICSLSGFHIYRQTFYHHFSKSVPFILTSPFIVWILFWELFSGGGLRAAGFPEFLPIRIGALLFVSLDHFTGYMKSGRHGVGCGCWLLSESSFWGDEMSPRDGDQLLFRQLAVQGPAPHSPSHSCREFIYLPESGTGFTHKCKCVIFSLIIKLETCLSF